MPFFPNQFSGYRIKHLLLVPDPVRSDQQIAGAVTCHPVNRYIVRKNLKALTDQIRVLIHCQQGKWLPVVFLCKPGVLQDIQHLNLYSVNRRIYLSQIVDRLQHHMFCLTRQAKDHMHNHLYTGCFQLSDRFPEYRQSISPIHPVCRFVMNGLQPQLHPYRLDRIQMNQHAHYILSQAIRPGTYG